MTRPTLALLLSAIATITGCDDDDDDFDTGFLPTETDSIAWRADLTGIGTFAQLRGEAQVATSGPAAFMAGAEILFDEAFVDRPWHVHFGTCATGGDIVGPPAAYPPLMTNGDGTDAVNIVVPAAIDPAGPYHVNVHLSAAELEVIIACGDLTQYGS